MKHGSLFSSIGLLDYGLHLAGLTAAWGCESDPWRRELWQQRFGVPCHADVRDAGAAWGRVDVVVGGFPCKGASTAGKRTGFDHPETVLWREMARAIGELRPRYVLVENVANILALHDGAVWGEVLSDLAALGFAVEWDCLPAAAVGAPHRRDRVLAVATHADGARWESGRLAEHSQREGHGDVADEDVAAPADADEGRGKGGAQRNGTASGRGQHVRPRHNADRPGVSVDWGEYGPAIQRWESVAGPAPVPLVRRVDARDAERVERSRRAIDRQRLSALGDGVQVQVGQLVGAYILEREAERMRTAA